MSAEIVTPAAPVAGYPASRWVKRIGFAACGVFGGYLALCAALALPVSNMLIKPPKKRMRHLESRRLHAYLRKKRIRCEEIQFASFDGTQLHGWFLERGWWRPTVIALHGVTGNRTSLIRFGSMLYAAGFNVFLFDGRGHGESAGDFVTYGYHEVSDVGAAIDHVTQRFKLRQPTFGIVGMSMGAAIALQTAARDPRIRAVWAESPFASLNQISQEYIANATRLPQMALAPLTWAASLVASQRGNFSVSAVSPLSIAPKITCPVQLVHGLEDDFVRPHHSRTLFDALTNAPKDLWLIGGARHTRCYHRAANEYRRRLPEFFRRHLGR
jgi:uncharacterized protein